MISNRKDQIYKLLKAIETGDEAAVSIVNEDKYIQHNPQTHEGSEGLAVLFKRLSKTSPRVNIVRIFEDGNFVFAHTEYDFSVRNIGFEIFRFENERAVEHWDNIQVRKGPNVSSHSMVDGVTEVTDSENTESNRNVIRSFVEGVLIEGCIENISSYIKHTEYVEHNPRFGDDLMRFRSSALRPGSSDKVIYSYKKLHRILADGNFVLSVCEGYADQVAASFFDLYRLKQGSIVEHWDTIEVIPPRSEWKNNNGKF